MTVIHIELEQAVTILVAFLLLDAALLSAIPLRRLFRWLRRLIYRKAERQIRQQESRNLPDKTSILTKLPRAILLFSLLRIGLRVDLPHNIRMAVRSIVKKRRIPRYLYRLLRSPSDYRRRYAILATGILPEENRAALLLPRLGRERRSYLRLRITAQLLSLSNPQLIRTFGTHIVAAIHSAFRTSPQIYRTRVLAMLAPHAPLIAAWIVEYGVPEDPWGARIAVTGFPALPRSRAESVMRQFLHHDEPELLKIAADTAYHHFRSLLLASELGQSSSHHIRCARNAALAEQANLNDPSQWQHLLRDADANTQAMSILRERITADTLPVALNLYHDIRGQVHSNTMIEQYAAASLLEPWLTYLLQRNTCPEHLLHDLLSQNHSTRFLQFLGSISAEEELSTWRRTVTELRSSYAAFDRDCRSYLSGRVRKALDIPLEENTYTPAKIRLRKLERMSLILLAFGTVSSVPLLYILLSGRQGNLIGFSLFYQELFVFYTLAINLVYSLLLLLSAAHIFRRRGSLDELELLFTPGILPSVSVLAPAYNEEKTIVASIHSLLSLRYPSFEVVIINDGSNDGTLAAVRDEFHMVPVDMPSDMPLATAPLWGLYSSRDVPNLLLIDKANGGKADSLNAGIGIASGEYICGIDADSLLEPDALLQLMQAPLDSDTETAAIGGNVLPINGCRVSGGTIRSVGLPRNPLAALQTIEYLRSFIAGRMGWAQAGGLLIISGAFGAFRRDRILEIGGYLTGTGRHRKDTVGEDMELVVRLRKYLYQRNIRHRVQYQHAANCWTEVPEAPGNLFRQRDRWNRGLIEILIFHRRLLFNARARSVGILAVPYFWLFEMLGPFLEVLGYAAVAVGLMFGFFSPVILVLLLAVSIAFGIAISSSALLLSDGSASQFKGRDVAVLLLYAVLENFGYRQAVAVQRAWSYLTYIFRNPGWQKMERKGFQPL